MIALLDERSCWVPEAADAPSIADALIRESFDGIAKHQSGRTTVGDLAQPHAAGPGAPLGRIRVLVEEIFGGGVDDPVGGPIEVIREV